jgi:two-component system OmpR family response regulator
MMGTRILLVASDAQLRATIARWLMSAGYAVELAENVRRATDVLANVEIALAIIAPEGLTTGGEAQPQLRGSVPHLITIGDLARGTIESAAPPSELDIFISEPSAQQDLLGRVRAALEPKPTAASQDEPSLFQFAGYTLDAGRRTLRHANGQDIVLTRAEFAMLLALVRQSGRVLSRDELSQAAVGRGAAPEDRSVNVLISRLRRKIEPVPNTPQIVLTVPGGGYKLGVEPQVVVRPSTPLVLNTAHAGMSVGAGVALQPAGLLEANAPAGSPRANLPPRSRSIGISRALAGLALLASIAALIIAYRSTTPAIRGTTLSAAPAQKFDAATIPLVYDSVRTRLSDYAREPDTKAIAISREGWGLSSGAADEAAARNEALERCRERDNAGFCRIYALGDNVAWRSASLPLPLPADIRADRPAKPAMTVEALNKAWQTMWQTAPPPRVTGYTRDRDHRALAVASTRTFYVSANRPNRDEAIRLAVERCSDFARTPCLLISVDGVWTVEIPRSYAIAAPFTLAGESQMSEPDRQRIAPVYAGPDWRALARGRSGRWYAVDGHATEAAAADAALQACRTAEAGCVVHAIGNWRVGDKL